jgi:DNA-binding transcriptional LysR family regulator
MFTLTRMRQGIAGAVRVQKEEDATIRGGGPRSTAHDLVATAPRSHAELVNRHGTNQLIPLPAPAASLRAFLYWHGEHDAEAANQWFMKQLRESWRAVTVTQRKRASRAR